MTIQEQIIHLKPQKQSYEQGQQERQQQEQFEQQNQNQSMLGGMGQQRQDQYDQQNQNQSTMGMGQRQDPQRMFSQNSQNQQSFHGQQGQGYGQGMQNQGYGQDQSYGQGQNQSYGQGQNQSYGNQQGGMTGAMGSEGSITGTQQGHYNQAGSLQRFGGRGVQGQRVICIPCELNAESMHIVEWVNNNVIHPGDRVILVAVRNKTASTMTQTLPTNLVDVNEVHALKEDEKSAEVLRKFTDLIPGIEAETKVLRGDYRSEIVQYVNAIQPNICVVAEEHTNGFKKVFKGSTSEYLVHNLKVPVLVLPMREE